MSGSVLVVEPMAGLISAVAELESCLLWVESDTEEAAGTVAIAAASVSDMRSVLSAGSNRAPAIYAPDGRTELVRLVTIPLDMAASVVNKVTRVLSELPLERLSPDTARAIARVTNALAISAAESQKAGGIRLAELVNNAERTIRLNTEQYEDYKRFARAVFSISLERSVYDLPGHSQSSVSSQLDPPMNPGVEL